MKSADGLLQVRVHEDPQHEPFRDPGTSITRTTSARWANSGRMSARMLADRFRNSSLKRDALVVGVERKVPDRRLHEVLEEVGAEGKVRHVVALLPGNLD